MAFTIPNEGAAAYSDQAEPDSGDLAFITAALNGLRVLTGLEVTPQGSPDMSVHVAEGITQGLTGGVALVPADDVVLSAADTTYPRFDLIMAYGLSVTKIEGDPGPNPVYPDFDQGGADGVPLAAVYVPANLAAVTADEIVDKRVLWPTQQHIYAPAGQGESVLVLRAGDTSPYLFECVQDDGSVGSALRFYVDITGDMYLDYTKAGTWVLSLAAGAILEVRDSTAAPIFRIDESDGSVHILTGTTIQADL